MNKYYVYLKLEENTLIIIENEIIDKNYVHLMDSAGLNRQDVYNTCKMYCLGYLYGSIHGSISGGQVSNSAHEFK